MEEKKEGQILIMILIMHKYNIWIESLWIRERKYKNRDPPDWEGSISQVRLGYAAVINNPTILALYNKHLFLQPLLCGSARWLLFFSVTLL